MHEIVQEHRRYDPTIVDLPTFLATGEGNCRASALGFAAITQAVYPKFEYRFQNFGGEYESHVRLVVGVEGQWLAMEKNTPVPIIVEPGSTLANIEEISNVVAAAPITSETIDGGAAEIPAGTDDAKKAAAAKNNIPDGIMDVISAAQKPTATYGERGAVSQAESAPSTVSFAEAQKDLANTNPVAASVLANIDRSYRLANPVKTESEISEAAPDEWPHRTEIPFTLVKIGKIIDVGSINSPETETKVIDVLAKLPKSELQIVRQLVEQISGTNSPLFSDLTTTEKESRQLRTEFLIRMIEQASQDDVQKHKQMFSDILTENKKIGHYFFRDYRLGYTTSGLPIDLSTQEIAELVRNFNQKKQKGADEIAIKFEKTIINSIGDILNSLELPTDLPKPRITIEAKTHDTNLNALKRFEKIRAIHLHAPLEDFSGLNNLTVGPISLDSIPNNAKLETFFFKDDPKAGITFVNPGPKADFSRLPERFKHRFELVLDQTTDEKISETMLERKSQLENCGRLRIWANFKDFDLTQLGGNKQLEQVTFRNPNVYQDWSSLAAIKEPTQINFEFGTGEETDLPTGNFKNFFDLQKLSRQYPQITFVAPAPPSWQVYEPDPDDYKKLIIAIEVTLKNGEGVDDIYYKVEEYGTYAEKSQADITQILKEYDETIDTPKESQRKQAELIALLSEIAENAPNQYKSICDAVQAREDLSLKQRMMFSDILVILNFK